MKCEGTGFPTVGVRELNQIHLYASISRHLSAIYLYIILQRRTQFQLFNQVDIPKMKVCYLGLENGLNQWRVGGGGCQVKIINCLRLAQKFQYLRSKKVCSLRILDNYIYGQTYKTKGLYYISKYATILRKFILDRSFQFSEQLSFQTNAYSIHVHTQIRIDRQIYIYTSGYALRGLQEHLRRGELNLITQFL